MDISLISVSLLMACVPAAAVAVLLAELSKITTRKIIQDARHSEYESSCSGWVVPEPFFRAVTFFLVWIGCLACMAIGDNVATLRVENDKLKQALVEAGAGEMVPTHFRFQLNKKLGESTPEKTAESSSETERTNKTNGNQN